ncbi:hypothetical protein [Candidatus Regiella endosymbiont of Tuberolachnus salignus]|uniref:hypothetical protein n=1 Tax=Candidatus Regiella endosymbiont of Tuberolachnus salignus TaxID=3077956 RepID=UPI0030D18168
MAIPFICSPTVTGNSQQYVTEVEQDVAGVGTRVGQYVTGVGNQAFVNRSSLPLEEHIQIIKEKLDQQELKHEQCAVILSMAEAKQKNTEAAISKLKEEQKNIEAAIRKLKEEQKNTEAKISELKKLLPDLQTKNDKNVKT